MDIKIRIKLREETEGENFILKMPVLDNTKLNNISLKTDSNREFTNRPSNLQGMKLLSFSGGNLRFNSDGILVNSDGEEGFLQSENGNEIVFGATNSNGYYQVTMEMSSATGLSSFVIYGDLLANQFPTELTIDGIPFYSDDYKLVIPLDSTQDTHTIVFKKWNRPNYNACITIIRATMEYLTFTNTQIDSLKSVERNNVNASEINYGILANSGSVELLDADGEIQDLVNDAVMPNSNVPVDILINNAILQNHISNDSNYDTTQDMFSMSLSNKIEVLDKLKYEGFAYPEDKMNLYQILYLVMSSLDSEIGYTDYTYFLRKLLDELGIVDFNSNCYNDSENIRKIDTSITTDVTFEEWYYVIVGYEPSINKLQNIETLYSYISGGNIPSDYLKLSTNRLDNMLSNKCMTPNGEKYIYKYLQTIEVEYPVIEYGYTYRQVLNDICQIAQLNMFVNKNNEYEFISARPLLLSEDSSKMIRITKDALKEPPSYDLFMKNKYQAVEISETNADSVIDYNTIIGKLDDSNLTDKYTNVNNGTNSDDVINLYQTGGGSSILRYNTGVAYGYVEDNYTSGSITINKKDKFNINKIIKFYTGKNINNENYIKHTINYTKRTQNATRLYSPTGDGWGQLQIDTNYTDEELSGVISQAKVVLYDDSSLEKTVLLTDKTNLGTLSYTLDSDGNYIINYTVLVGKKEIKLQGSSSQTVTQGEFYPDATAEGIVETYIPHSLEISFYGDKRVIYFDNTSVSSSNINEAEVIANFGTTTTKLLQDKCTYNGEKMSSVIKDNILNDYQYGISNLRLEMFTTDLNYKNGTQAKTLESGQVLNVGDIAFLTNDKDKYNQQRYWCVYDNEYKYDGSLDESVKLYQKREYYGLYNTKYFLGLNYLLDNGDLEITTSGNDKIIKSNNSSLAGKLVLDNNITIIGKNAFLSNGSLTEIIMQDNVTKIDKNCFSLCSFLKKVTLSKNLSIIEDNSFEACSRLTDIYYNNTMSNWNLISKGTNWDRLTGNYTIHCSDGDIPKS